MKRTLTIKAWRHEANRLRQIGETETAVIIERAVNQVAAWPFKDWWRFRKDQLRTLVV